MRRMQNMLFSWHFDMGITIFVAAATILYLYITRFTITRNCIYFFAGLALMTIALASPLHVIGMHYLFSAHMITHILLLLIAGPFLVAGIPNDNRLQPLLQNVSKLLYKAPFIAWMLGVSVMWLLHIPALFDQLVAMKNMHENTMSLLSYTHIFSLLVAGILFSWPLINPYEQYRINALNGVFYLTSACVFCSLLGLLITFAPQGLYTGYMMHDMALQTVRTQWGISAEMDQQMAGLIMWVPCCMIYLTGAMLLLKKWFSEKDEAVLMPHTNTLMQ